jgi:hypothetical protein
MARLKKPVSDPQISRTKKTMAKKQKLSGDVPPRVIPSAPPGSDPPLAWLLMTIERAGVGNSKAARVARSDLDAFLGSAVSYLLGFALREEDSIAKQWAGQFLAGLEVSLEKHHEKLNAHPAYRGTRAKLRKKLRRDMLFPKSPIGQAVQRELNKAERQREALLLLRGVLKTRGLRLVSVDEKKFLHRV